ncbi:MAG: preprotein translocase subunit SecG [Candidatus Zambryskibacteria bacterium RIFCSPLOWO2_01_FULL_39_39]|uniref:Protein-export membrane protein SecG n=1 Tax=Candidatus Zambryskibacteria bacterium RIFCSPLOWO2_01_FULL_39_39 TaxID=1802758 RepID=A0A1G2TYN7_9BACT|nr:MAG: preprotein translocase subunit SecG [Candidatus Zambryskibacteria bacterium RIFCSPHIGHO2_01_FULL_39_63]OHA95309.1 MAG: preprotein translocase subunit SecG [Candidatus Zambryskibacteria bacterium RIFCSPHIGHO2_02_FULL_39_19]OHA98887.1 MAG: preprotein translocase subunit SecG [Candidatus Zambryskibacteria bacterium RIFCSPHIGHO2_12_FULL_39_21]OHB01740.1 MAG: preprotein translocase subunit SecG [Candidatus Zambryskibacteria bacterium RIFCSPLOWO2_01_FULL_39_39]
MLSYIQIVLAVLLSALILVQQSEGSLGSAFGGGNMDTAHRTRRGAELWIFRGTIIIACLFVASTLLNLLY